LAQNKPKRLKSKALKEVKIERKRNDSDSRLRQADRLARALEILKLFHGSKNLTKKELATRLECSTKTIERTFQALELAGVPVIYDRASFCYRLQEDCIVPPCPLTMDESLDEARAVAVGHTVIGQSRPSRKLKAKPQKTVLARGVKEIVELASGLTAVLELKTVDSTSSNTFLRIIQIALAKRQRLKGEYFSPYSEHTSTILIDPYRLCFIRGAWYLIGRPDYSDCAINLRVVRFHSLEATDYPATILIWSNIWGLLGEFFEENLAAMSPSVSGARPLK
jgi:biotin operon repressor